MAESPFSAITPPASSPVIARNIQALLEQRKISDARQGKQERLAEAVTRFTGSMQFVYLHLALFGLWIGINTVGLPLLPKFDPSLVILAMAASVEAIFLSTFVLISQNRMQRLADQRADLNLHISLLAEHEITRLLQLVTAIANRMDLEEAANPELTELAQDVRPEQVVAQMDKIENSS